MHLDLGLSSNTLRPLPLPPTFSVLISSFTQRRYPVCTIPFGFAHGTRKARFHFFSIHCQHSLDYTYATSYLQFPSKVDLQQRYFTGHCCAQPARLKDSLHQVEVRGESLSINDGFLEGAILNPILKTKTLKKFSRPELDAEFQRLLADAAKVMNQKLLCVESRPQQMLSNV
jgi:hypothetical protein